MASAAEDKAEIRKRLEMLEDRSAAGGGRATAQQVRSLWGAVLLLLTLLSCAAGSPPAAVASVPLPAAWPLLVVHSMSPLLVVQLFPACTALTHAPAVPTHVHVQPAKAGGGFGVVHLLLVALLAFLVSFRQRPQRLQACLGQASGCNAARVVKEQGSQIQSRCCIR